MPLLDPKGEYIQEHWRNRVGPMAEERGLVMRVPPVQTRTRRAHEAAAFARAHGRFAVMDRALFRAFFEQGLDLNDLDVLLAVARAASLEADALRRALDDGDLTPAVEADQQLAARLGIRSVPTMLVADDEGRAEPVVGAVPYESLEPAITRAIARSRQQP